MIDSHALNIFTDASVKHHPRRSGIGIRFIFPEALSQYNSTIDFQCEGYKGGKIGQMELKACCEALGRVLEFQERFKVPRIVIHTDSKYVKEGYYSAMYLWSRNGWVKRGGAPVANVPEWKELLKLKRKIGRVLDFELVKGHKGNPDNEAVDKMAKASAENPLNKTENVIISRRKYSGSLTKMGCIKMLGQRESIHIIDTELLKEQMVDKLRYEVIDPSSENSNLVDFAYSQMLTMKAGHNYSVRFNKDQSYPQIVRVYKELEKGNLALKKSPNPTS